MLAYSARNRSAYPYSGGFFSESASYRSAFPDPAANPYLCFAALLMAGLDGIKKMIGRSHGQKPV